MIQKFFRQQFLSANKLSQSKTIIYKEIKKAGHKIISLRPIGASGLQVAIAAIEKAATMGDIPRETIAKAMENFEVDTVGGHFRYPCLGFVTHLLTIAEVYSKVFHESIPDLSSLVD